jgi:hypothetical protein
MRELAPQLRCYLAQERPTTKITEVPKMIDPTTERAS